MPRRAKKPGMKKPTMRSPTVSAKHKVVITRGKPDMRQPRGSSPRMRDPTSPYFQSKAGQRTIVDRIPEQGTIFDELRVKHDVEEKLRRYPSDTPISYEPPGQAIFRENKKVKRLGRPGGSSARRKIKELEKIEADIAEARAYTKAGTRTKQAREKFAELREKAKQDKYKKYRGIIDKLLGKHSTADDYGLRPQPTTYVGDTLPPSEVDIPDVPKKPTRKEPYRYHSLERVAKSIAQIEKGKGSYTRRAYRGKVKVKK